MQPSYLATWRKCLQDSHSSLYYDGGAAGIPALVLKCEALQALERYEEAVEELESCAKSAHGEGDETVAAKLKEAKQLLKKSKRVSLHKVELC